MRVRVTAVASVTFRRVFVCFYIECELSGCQMPCWFKLSGFAGTRDARGAHHEEKGDYKTFSTDGRSNVTNTLRGALKRDVNVLNSRPDSLLSRVFRQ